MLKTLKFYLAFTLAEVLIALLIVGVVASLVIPAIIQDTQDAELKTAWKKQYGVLTQATAMVLSDNGGSLKSIGYLAGQYLQYMSVTKKCTGGQWGGNCWSVHDMSAESSTGATKFLNNSLVYMNIVPLGGGNSSAIENDGTYVIFGYQDSTCQSNNILFHNYYSRLSDEGIDNLCGWITVDVNGAKAPNTVGKDIFGVWIRENGIVPYGAKDLSGTCNPSASGLGCSAKYLYQ
jgi:type II secretory pathway pseudopilin PulG